MSREQTTIIAYHEAGHAVMAMANGFRVTRVTCVANADSQGRTEYEVPNPPTLESHRGEALVAAAGLAADYIHAKKFGLNNDEELKGYFGDRADALIHLDELGHGEHFEVYLSVAIHVLERDRVWGFVEILAELLMKIGEINGRDVLYNVSQQVPKVGITEFQVIEMATAQNEGRIG